MSNNKLRIDSLFISALELPTEDRAVYLDEACGSDLELRARVDKLLAARSQGGSFLEVPAAELRLRAEMAATIEHLSDSEPSSNESDVVDILSDGPGTQIGPYKLLQKLGEGGMGAVYMAEQMQPVKRRVALKIIKPGMDTRQVIARFEAERQVLAMMDHPNIAKVLDVGTTQHGRPFFVMELVNGRPITEHCDHERLTTRERLELFVQVCQAVQHAHQRGIIHRDLKPSNILVARYDERILPKVIDFGVAKAVTSVSGHSGFTQFGQLIGTLEYMSPEQAAPNQLDVDTRSDIYSLGIVLYQLLTGEIPFDRQRLRAAALDEVLRIIREVEPMTPSKRVSSLESSPDFVEKRKTTPAKLGLLLRGELDWIVLKSLSKNREERYRTTVEFAADIERHLSGDVVAARPPSVVYRFRKWATRNRGILFTLASIAAILIVATIASAFWAVEAQSSRGKLAIALQQEQVISKAIAESLAREQELVRTLNQDSYYTQIQLAYQWLLEGTNDQARQLLGNCGEELRNWEWRYLDRLTQVDWVSQSLFSPRPGSYPRNRQFALRRAGDLLAFANGEAIELVQVQKGQFGERTALQPVLEEPNLLPGMQFESIAFSHDGRLLAVGGNRGITSYFFLWDVASGEQLASFTERDLSDISGVGFADNDRCLVLGTRQQIIIWDWQENREITRIQAEAERYPIITQIDARQRAWFDSLSISADGSKIAAADAAIIRVWNASDGQSLQEIDHGESIRQISFGDSNHRIATLSQTTIKVWDLESQRSILEQPSNGVQSVLLVEGQEQLLIGRQDHVTQRIDLKSGRRIDEWRGHEAWVSYLDFAPATQLLVSVDTGGTAVLRKWPGSETGDPPAWISASSATPRYVSNLGSPTSEEEIFNDLLLQLNDAKSGQELARIDLPVSTFQPAFSDDGRLVAYSETPSLKDPENSQVETVIQVARVETGEVLHRLIVAKTVALLYTVGFSHDATRIVANYAINGESWLNHELAVWNLNSGQRESLQPIDAPIFSRNDNLLYGLQKNEIFVLDLATDQQVKLIDDCGGGPVVEFQRKLLLDPTGKLLVRIHLHEVHLIDVQRGTLVHKLKHVGRLRETYFNADATRLVTVDHLGKTRFWDVQTGRSILVLEEGRVNWNHFAETSFDLIE